jgi:hypothetical protein
MLQLNLFQRHVEHFRTNGRDRTSSTCPFYLAGFFTFISGVGYVMGGIRQLQAARPRRRTEVLSAQIKQHHD